jgi:hypothetical protein
MPLFNLKIPSFIEERVFHGHTGRFQDDITMKATYDNADNAHQAISTLHELIALGMTEWVPIVTILLHRFVDIEPVMDDDTNKLLHRLALFINEERDRDPIDRDQRLMILLSELPAWRFHAVHGKQYWNPLNEPLRNFADRHGPVTVFESPDPKPQSAEVIDWLHQHHDSKQVQDQNALAP